MATVETLEVIEGFSETGNPEELETRLQDTVRRLGFTEYSYLGFRPPITNETLFVAANYPDGWVERYLDQRYLYTDPMLTTAKRSRLPFYWKSLRRSADLTRGEKKILNEGAEFGIRYGLTVPVHGPNGEFATLSLASQENEAELDALWTHKVHLFHLIAHHFHAAVWERIATDDIDMAPVLSPREAEILTWTARGKSAWEISEILNVGEGTVVTHLKRVHEKLNTSNKTHAVAKACVKGLIRP